MMSPPMSLKREFLKKWVMGLKICKSWNKNKTLLARKNAIKLSAYIAIAVARKGVTSWSRALICTASKGSGTGRRLVHHMLGSMVALTPRKASSNYSRRRSVIIKMRRTMLGEVRGSKRSGFFGNGCARSVTKSLVRRRTEVLKRLVPGGRFMDGIGLIDEALDYILALRAQVDVMRSLADVSEIDVNLHGN